MWYVDGKKTKIKKTKKKNKKWVRDENEVKRATSSLATAKDMIGAWGEEGQGIAASGQ